MISALHSQPLLSNLTIQPCPVAEVTLYNPGIPGSSNGYHLPLWLDDLPYLQFWLYTHVHNYITPHPHPLVSLQRRDTSATCGMYFYSILPRQQDLLPTISSCNHGYQAQIPPSSPRQNYCPLNLIPTTPTSDKYSTTHNTQDMFHAFGTLHHVGTQDFSIQ